MAISTCKLLRLSASQGAPSPFPLLILLEVQCLAGLLPDPTGKGPREALQPAIAGMVRKRDDDDATPLFSWFCLIVKLETRARRTGRGVVFFVFFVLYAARRWAAKRGAKRIRGK